MIPEPLEALGRVFDQLEIDPKCAAKYDTTQMLDQGPDMLRNFVSYLTCSLAMDERQLAVGSLLDAPARMQ